MVVIITSESLFESAYLGYLHFAFANDAKDIDYAGDAFTSGNAFTDNNIFADISFFFKACDAIVTTTTRQKYFE